MNKRFVLGLLILLLTAGALQFGPDSCRQIGLCQPTITILNGEIGGSKEGLFLDRDVQRILRDRYGLDVQYKVLGGEDQVCGAPSSAERDFLWPGTEIAVERYKGCQGGKAGKAVEYPLVSPIVFYSWAGVTDAFLAQGWLQDNGGVYYLDLASFAPVLMERRPWKTSGLDLYGSINVNSTDPANSNSGQMWAALLATMLNKGQVPNQGAMQQVLPDVRTYFEHQGFMQKKSIDLFIHFITVGMGGEPIIVGYESLLPDYVNEIKPTNQNNDACAALAPVRVIYPRPTVWASHPLIAETDNAVRLQQALMDPDIQKLAWERHGFRAPLGKAPSNLAANCFKVPPTVDSTVQLPQADVMDTLLNSLK